LFLLVSITSTNDGSHPFIKHVNKYISDLDNTVYLHDSSECVDDINTMYNHFETKVSQVIDHHAPIKYIYTLEKTQYRI
jgi:hypothetical protein